MNNIDRMVRENPDAMQFAKSYFDYLATLFTKMDLAAIGAFVEEVEESRREGSTLFIAGNGGSAGTASHMANDFGLDVMKKSGTDRPLRVIALTDNIPIMTAISNDDGYDNIFFYQLKMLYRTGDKLIVISASGNSPNVVTAAGWVKEQGGKVMGLIGFDGGKLKDICDISIHVRTPKGEYGPVEDIHMIIDHLVSHYLMGRIHIEQSERR